MLRMDTTTIKEVDKDNLVRQGNEIEYYDYGEVELVNSYGSSVEVEIYDYNTGEYHTFEMNR
jgi:hypothetical protein